MFFLHTDVIIAVMNRRDEALDARIHLEIASGSYLAVPAPVLFELRYGAEKSPHPARNHARIDDFLTAIAEIVDFDKDDAGEASEIRSSLEAGGVFLGPYDILIAAQARRRGATLVTLNRREFERVSRLTATDWRS
jgi:tRNA(fMet)-specific endonuclease VapC